ncbi:MAG: MBL fold metallo-hydrolase [Candidatus Bipolaricaulota bacterium]
MGQIRFLGTAGARFVVARQLRYSAGTWLELGNTQLLVDPGPGTLVRARRARPALAPEKLTGILLSHKHLDHSSDTNVMLEAMAEGGRRQRGTLLAPTDALEGGDPVILRYVRSFPRRIRVWRDGQPVELDQLTVTPVRHQHGVETYGLVVDSPEGRLGFVVDGRMSDELPERYAGCQLLVLNTVRREWTPDVDHLSLPESLELIRAVRPHLAVLTHFGMTMLRAGPRRLAEQATQKLGTQVRAAADGMTVSSEAWGTPDDEDEAHVQQTQS